MRFEEYPETSGLATANAQGAIREPPGATPSREAEALLRIGLGKPLIARIADLAQINGTSIEAELLATGQIDEASYFEALSRELGLAFLKTIDAEKVQDLAGLDSQLVRP